MTFLYFCNIFGAFRYTFVAIAEMTSYSSAVILVLGGWYFIKSFEILSPGDNIQAIVKEATGLGTPAIKTWGYSVRKWYGGQYRDHCLLCTSFGMDCWPFQNNEQVISDVLLTFDRKSVVLLPRRIKGKRSSECVKKMQWRQTMAKTLETRKQAWDIKKNASKLPVLACPHEPERTATVKGRWSSISLDHPRLLFDLDYEPHTAWLTSIPQCLFQYDSVLNSISMTDKAESNRSCTCRERNGSRCVVVDIVSYYYILNFVSF